MILPAIIHKVLKITPIGIVFLLCYDNFILTERKGKENK